MSTNFIIDTSKEHYIGDRTYNLKEDLYFVINSIEHGRKFIIFYTDGFFIIDSIHNEIPLFLLGSDIYKVKCIKI